MTSQTRKSALIHATAARAYFPRFDRSNVFLMDPDKPKEDPNELLNRVHNGQMLDPASMNHNCPFCSRTMAWDLFIAHAEACFRKWRKVVRGLRVHQVPAFSPEYRSIEIAGVPASADSEAEKLSG